MIIKITKNYYISIAFFFHLLFNALCSHWVQEVYPFPLNIQRIITVLIYFPYFIFFVYKFLSDLKNIALFKGINVLYYSFCFYYFLISIWRYINHYEFKESVYFFIVIIGGLALLMQMNKDQSFSKECVLNNVIICSSILCLYRIVFFFLVNKPFSYSPINAIVFACVFLISIPFLASRIDCKNKFISGISSLLLVISIVFVLLSGSRASFFLLLFAIFAIMLFMIIKFRKLVVRFVLPILISMIVVGVLFACNIKDVRKNVIREVWFLNSFVKVEDSVVDPVDDIEEDNIETLIDQQNQQIDRSDTGRKALMTAGINEIKKNPIFGTGDVMYEQQMTETYIANQSSHNFIIESLVSFGILGSVMLMSLLLFVFIKSFKHINFKNIFYVLITICVFLAFSFIQPLFFNAITLYFFMVIICAFFKMKTTEENI